MNCFGFVDSDSNFIQHRRQVGHAISTSCHVCIDRLVVAFNSDRSHHKHEDIERHFCLRKNANFVLFQARSEEVIARHEASPWCPSIEAPYVDRNGAQLSE